MLKKVLVTLTCCFFLPTFQAKADTLLSFDSIPLGTTTPFVLTAGAITATFSSPDGPAFSIAPSPVSTQTGNFLLDADVSNHTLVIAFSELLGQMVFDYVMRSSGPGIPGTLSASLFNDATLLGTASVSGFPMTGSSFITGLIGFPP